MLLHETILGKDPSLPAIVGAEETLTYGQLDRRANRFANALRAAGLNPGDRVGIRAAKSPSVVTAMIGTLRAGGVYVPIDPQSPAPRAQLVAREAGIRHAVVSRGLSLDVPCSIPVESPEGSESFAAHPAKPDDLAYLLFTSGSTGVPKGVMISHRNALSFSDWAADLVGLAPGDRVASHAPFHFDLSVFDLYSTFRAGAAVHLIGEEMAASPRGLAEFARKVTVWYSVPSALVLLMDRGGFESAPDLRVVIYAGEAFPLPWLRRLMAAVPKARYFNFFGPTETNVCLYHELREPPAEAVPVGIPASGARAEIVDGELLIDGPTVMLGYWNGPAASRPYRTGDLVSRREDGVFLFHGRRDHMVKVHGYRVELGEVEAAVQSHPKVRDAAVLAGDQRLVAFVAGDATVLELKRHCAERLPKYMVPHEVRFVTDLPRTSTGKADRVRLKSMMEEKR